MDRRNALQIIENAVFAQRGSHLTDLEKAAFQGAWENLTYQEMGQDDRFPYSDRTLKDAGSRLFKLLSKVWGEKVSKTNFKSALERHCTLHTVNDRRHDWGDAIEVPLLFGREQELGQLEQWVTTPRSRLVALVGMGGMGKTALAVKLVEQVQSAFELFVWISLRDAPALVEVVNRLIEFFKQEQATEAELREDLHRRLIQLFRYLTDCRCLVVFDNADTLLDSEQLAGQYRADYENYANFFQRIANARHQSCVILTGRELPREIWALAGNPSPVQILQLTGLTTTAVHQLFMAQNLPLEPRSAEVQTLTEHYAGNPLALKIAAKTIRELFAADLSEFLAHDSIVFGDIQELLSQQFSRLSTLEQTIMYWLALGREPVSLRQLQENLLPGASMAQLIEAIGSLDQRYLIEKSGSSYTQQPVVMEYVTSRLIQQMVAELQTGQLRDFSGSTLVCV
jgi:NB-ARC domain